MATSKDECQDVTWRYSRNHRATRQRRKLVRPGWLVKAVLQLTKGAQTAYSQQEKKRLLKRRCVEEARKLKQSLKRGHTFFAG